MEDAGYTSFGDLDGEAIAEWAASDEMAKKEKQGEITARTLWKYYRLVRAYLSYCSDWEYIASNPADTAVGRATPEATVSGFERPAVLVPLRSGRHSCSMSTAGPTKR